MTYIVPGTTSFSNPNNSETYHNYRSSIAGTFLVEDVDDDDDESLIDPDTGEIPQEIQDEIDRSRRRDDIAHLEKHHIDELLKSSIHLGIIGKNFRSLQGNTPHSYLLYSDKIERTNTGRVPAHYINKYAHLEKGGWWCSGIDLLNIGEDSLWGCFKPDHPRVMSNGKSVKYEHPEKTITEVFALKVPAEIWEKVARRFNVDLPMGYQSADDYEFWRWVVANPRIPLNITEGAKKAAAQLSCGYVTIALPGIFNGCPFPKNEYGEKIGSASLIPQLAIFAQAGRQINICFDQDLKRNTIRNVNKATEILAKQFIKRDCQVRVMSWFTHLGKGIDDVIFAHGEGILGNIFSTAITFDVWKVKQLKKLTYPADVIVNQRYLEDVSIPDSAQLIALGSAKDTGKTEFIKRFCAPYLTTGEKKILLVTLLVQLGVGLCLRIGIPYRTEVKEYELGNLQGMGLCFHSLHDKCEARFNPKDWKGAVLVLDEVKQLVFSMLTTSNCSTYRSKILQNFKKLLNEVIDNGGKVLIADADLSDVEIDYLLSLIDNKNIKPFIIQNEYKHQGWDIYKFEGSDPTALVKELEKRLQAGEKALVHATGQRSQSAWGSTNLEKHFKKLMPDLRILRIDSSTVTNPDHPAYECIKNINEIIKDYDLVLATSTIGTGVSIDEEHFDGVWGIFQGIHSTDSVRQQLARCRPPVPRYVWIRKFGLSRSKVGNHANDFGGLIAGENRRDEAIKKQLRLGGFEEGDNGKIEYAHLETWAKLGAVHNLGLSNYEEQTIAELIEEGHTIHNVTELGELPTKEELDAYKREVKITCKESYDEHKSQVVAVESPDHDKLKALKEQQVKTDKEQLQYKKGTIEDLYKVEVTDDLIEKHDKEWYSPLRLHYFWGIGREYLSEKDLDSIQNSFIDGDGKRFILDTNKKVFEPKIRLFDNLGIDKLLKDDEYHNNHPVIEDIAQNALARKWEIKETLGINLSEDITNIQLVKTILNLVDLKMPFLGKRGSKGDQSRYYGAAIPDFEKNEKGKPLIFEGRAIRKADGRDEIFAKWIEVAETKIAKEKAEQELAAKLTALIQEKKVREDNLNEWETPQSQRDIVEMLSLCDSLDIFHEIQKLIPENVLRSALQILDIPTQMRFKSWVQELVSDTVQRWSSVENNWIESLMF